MASYLFQALLLLLSVVSCALCAAGSADPANMSVVLFKQWSNDVSKLEGGGVGDFDVAHISSPFLLGIGDVMIALVRASLPNQRNNILTKYIGAEGDNWGDRAMEDNGKNWEAQLAWKDYKTGEISFAPVARDNSVYVLSVAVSQYAPFFSQQTAYTEKWDFQLTVGRITSGANASEKKIEWDTPVPLDRFVTGIPQKIRGVSLIDGSAFLTEDGTFVFVLRTWNLTSRNSAFVIARSKDLQEDFKISYVTNAADCYPIFFSWGEQLFMVLLDCFRNDDGLCNLQQSNDMGETWGEASAPLAKKLGTLAKGRGSFTPITIEGERVLLFTQEVPESVDPSVQRNINLIVADEEHYEDVGLILVDVSSPAIGSFLYTDNELFFLGIQIDARTEKIIFVRLKEQLGKIKQLVTDWSAEKRAKRPEDNSAAPLSSEVSPQ